MEKFKKYKHGRRVYTQLDKQTKQITVFSKKHQEQESGKPVKAEIDFEQAMAETRFADSFAVGYSSEEFYMDFFKTRGGKSALVSRVIISPKVIKRFYQELSGVIANEVKQSQI